MKKINQLMVLAFAALALTGIQSCSKTAFHQDYLVGTWTMTNMVEKSSFLNETPDNPAVDGDQIKSESSSELTYVGTANVTGSSSNSITYDGLGAGLKYQSSESIVEADNTKSEHTSTYTDNTSVIVKDTATKFSNIDYSITFNKDKTFVMTKNTMDESSYVTNGGIAYRSLTTSSTENKNTITGSWAFIGNDKNIEEKNNERIGLWISKSEYLYISSNSTVFTDLDATDVTNYVDNNSSSSDENTNNGTKSVTGPDMVWKMVEGSAKEMTITSVYESVSAYTNKNISTSGAVTVITETSNDRTYKNDETTTFTKQ